MCIEIGTTELVSNINTCKLNHISKVVRVVLLFIRRSTFRFDVYIFHPIVFWCLLILVMSMYFRCRQWHFCVMYISYVLLIYGAVILLWVRTWNIFFSMNGRQSDVEPTSYWRLDFWHVSVGTSVIQSYIEFPGSWHVDFEPPVSCLISGLVSPSPWIKFSSYISIYPPPFQIKVNRLPE